MAAYMRFCRQAIRSPRSRAPTFPQTCGACHGQKFVMASGGMSSRAIHLVSGERARQSRRRRLRQSRSLHRLPRRARHPERDRSQVADQQVQRSGHLRQVPRQCQARNTCRAFTDRRLRAAIGRRRSAPTATAFTPSRLPTIPTPRWPRPTYRTLAPRATTAYGCRTNSACPAAGSRRIWRAITAWRKRWGRPRWPTAPVATVCTTFCRPAIRTPPSITPTWPRPAGNAIPAPTTSSSPARYTSTAPPRPTSAARSSASSAECISG